MVFNWLHMGIFLFFGVGLLMACAALLTPLFLSPKSRDPQMWISYECGILPETGAWIRFHINYYVYALIFLAFEVDVLYLFPVAVAYGEAVGLSAFFKVFLFILVLGLAVVFFRAKGVFRWPKRI